MPNLIAVSLTVSDKKIFKDFKNFYVLLPLQPEFLKESNSFKNISVKFHQNQMSSFREEDV